MKIIKLLENYLNDHIKNIYINDPCPPQFLLSIFKEDKIMLTVIHMNYAYSEIIHPEEKIEDIFDSLFAKTM